MVQLTCDNCGDEREIDAIPSGNDTWILGFDIEVESPNALRRSLTFLDRWDDRRVLELGAIHLCCTDCKQQYIAKSKAA